jgi:hypothetical protein
MFRFERGLKPLPNEFSVIIIKTILTTNYQLLFNCNKVGMCPYVFLLMVVRSFSNRVLFYFSPSIIPHHCKNFISCVFFVLHPFLHHSPLTQICHYRCLFLLSIQICKSGLSLFNLGILIPSGVRVGQSFNTRGKRSCPEL